MLAASLVLTAAAGCDRSSSDRTLPLAPGLARGANVILITLDTTRADYLGCYGKNPSFTPVLDRLCAEGVVFDNAISPSPVTLPAHASILTGLSPPQHDARYNGEFRMSPDVPTLAGDLSQAGYRTAAFVSSFVLDRRFGTSRGFDVYDDTVEGSLSRRGVISHNERTAAAVTDAALAYINGSDKTRPLFLWVHYYDAHAPYVSLDGNDPAGTPAAYLGEIGDVDAEIARLLHAPALDADKSLLVVTADHGESLGEHGERTHGLFLYDSTTRVPLVLRLPQRELAGHRVASLATLMDIKPSVLALLGIADDDASDGINWLSQQRTDRDLVYQEAALPLFDYGFAPVYAMRSSNARFVEGAHPEYYDLSTDPHELDNLYPRLAKDSPNSADRMRQRLDAQFLTTTDLVRAAKEDRHNDPEALAKLRSLGYLGDAVPMDAGALPDTRDNLEVIDLHEQAVQLVNQRQFSQALAVLDRAVELSPDNIALLRLKSKSELLSGRLPQAEQTLSQLVAIHRNPDSLVLLAQLHILRGEFDAADLLLGEAEKLEPEHGGIAIARGDIVADGGDKAGAIKLYTRAITVDGARTGAIARARIAALNGKTEKKTESVTPDAK